MIGHFEKFGLLIIGFLVFSSTSYADTVFRNLRGDKLVPVDCRETELRDFSGNQKLQTFAVSSLGAKQRGFDLEYPIQRKDITTLWQVFKKDQHEANWFKNELKNNPALARDYRTMLAHYEDMGFDFSSEGEVLEILAIVEYLKNVPAGYFVTGSVEYHAPGDDNRAIGELDLLVGHTDTCSVVAVGEAKAGLKQLGHAREQLARFMSFISRHRNKLAISPFDLF